ncbi:MAG: hypothetical protein GWP61_21155 [Chloroflexi bacterium]|nr:hypothetical protein [Chloroflexota bacterium]
MLPGDLLFATQDGCHRETDHFAAVLNDPNEDITGDDLKSFRAGFVDVHYEGIDFVFLFDFVLLLLETISILVSGQGPEVSCQLTLWLVFCWKSARHGGTDVHGCVVLGTLGGLLGLV